MDASTSSVRASSGGCCNWHMLNVVLLGVAFMFMFTAFQTCGMVEESVLEGVKNETNSTLQGNGYTSLSIIYAVFAASNWIAPSVISVLGPKISMVLGGIIYTVFIASFLRPMDWSLYAGSALLGIGAAVIWTGQGTFLTLNSTAETMGRNSGIFWALLQCSLLIGNMYVYFAFQGETIITQQSRTQLFIVLTAICGAGVLVLFLLRTKPSNPSDSNMDQNTDSHDIQSSSGPANKGPIDALKRSVKLFFTKEMMLLSVTFAYTGFELMFFSGVYGTCLGHTRAFGKIAKSMIGLSGIFIGIGEILGGSLFGLFGKMTNKYGRDPVVLLGFLVHTVCFYLVFLNLPMDSPIDETVGKTYITPNIYVALLCSFLLGFGDSCFNTQIFSIIGYMYAEDSAPAFAIYKFLQSLASAAGFLYSQKLLLHWQLLILVISNLFGIIGFLAVEWNQYRIDMYRGYSKIASDN